MGAVAVLGLASSAFAAEPFSDLAAKCAPSVHPQTLRAVVQHESGFNPLAIGVNGSSARSIKPRGAAEAVAIATDLIARGVQSGMPGDKVRLTVLRGAERREVSFPLQ